MRKEAIGSIVAALLLIGILSLVGYQNYVVKDLEVNLKAVRLESISLSGTRLGVDIEIYNPSMVDARVGKLYAEFFANDVKLSVFDSQQPFKVPSKQAIKKSYSVDLSFGDIGYALINAIRERDVRWQLNGYYEADLWLTNYKKEFNIEG